MRRIEPSTRRGFVTQGITGDCYYTAALASIARQHPEMIENMIHTNPDGTYSVTYYRKRGVWEWVTGKPKYIQDTMVVNNEFPVGPKGPLFAKPGDTSGGKPELWAMIAEKAYAQSRGSYDAANRGSLLTPPMEWITGKETKVHGMGDTSLAQLAEWDRQGYAVTVGTHWFPTGNLRKRHTYYLLAVDEKAKTVTLGNPWGYADVTLTEKEFHEVWSGVNANPLK